MFKVSKLVALNTLVLLSATANTFADAYPPLYPFIPYETSKVLDEVKKVAERDNIVHNLFQIERQGLSEKNTTEQPWTSTYWPMKEGIVAAQYRNKRRIQFIRTLSWRTNLRRFNRRLDDLQNWHRMSNSDLADLAPSEKYDILMGDNSFGLTRRIWDKVERWGKNKDHGFINEDEFYSETLPETLPRALAQNYVTSGEITDPAAALARAQRVAAQEVRNYVLEDRNGRIATWEGICNGWSAAAGIVPRPLHTVDIQLRNGKTLRFFPDDIKGLAALYWNNSLIQDGRNYDDKDQRWYGGVLMAGNRCNNGRSGVSRDQWGRFYDSAPDMYSGEWIDKCSGVHPAIWHLGLVNIIGVDGRSFIVEKKVSQKVDNHPLKGYRAKYFNPYNGDYGTLQESMKPLTERDQFRAFRNPETRYIVGVKLKMFFLGWENPEGDNTDSESKDTVESEEMLYDLELDARYNIIGGQWRTIETGRGGLIRGDRTMPDFFWVITKHWRSHDNFAEKSMPEAWTDKTQQPPVSWLAFADNVYHSFMYHNHYSSCEVKNRETGEKLFVNCHTIENKPQPMLQVLNALVEQSRLPERQAPSRRDRRRAARNR